MQSASANKPSDSYRVPQRFSLAEILVMMTVFAVLFGVLRQFGAPATLYLFLGSQAVVICLVQMWFGEVPRGASTVVGCFFLPAWVWVLAASGSVNFPQEMEGSLVDICATVAFGGLLGYCTGALAAGVFLVMDMYDGRAGRSNRRRTPAR